MNEEQNNNENKSKVHGDNAVLLSVLAYIHALVLIPLLIILNNKKEERDEFMVFHTNQGIILFVFYAAVSLLSSSILFLIFMPIWILFWLFLVILTVIGIFNVLSNKKKPLPLIGNLFTVIK